MFVKGGNHRPGQEVAGDRHAGKPLIGLHFAENELLLLRASVASKPVCEKGHIYGGGMNARSDVLIFIVLSYPSHWPGPPVDLPVSIGLPQARSTEILGRHERMHLLPFRMSRKSSWLPCSVGRRTAAPPSSQPARVVEGDRRGYVDRHELCRRSDVA